MRKTFTPLGLFVPVYAKFGINLGPCIHSSRGGSRLKMQEVIPVLSVSLFLPFLSSCVCIGRHLNLVHDWDKRSDDDHKDVNDDVDVDDCFSFLLFCRSLSVSFRPDMSDTVDWRKKQISFSVLPPPPTPKPHPLFPL